MPESDVTKMKVADLKRELKLRGLPQNGNKNELQDRLQTALLEGDISLEDSAITDAIDDDDVSLTDEDEHKLLSDDHEDLLLKSPVSTPTLTIPTEADLLLPIDGTIITRPLAVAASSSLTVTDSPATAAVLPAKKIVLKRNNSQLLADQQQQSATGSGTTTLTAKENAAPSVEATTTTATTIPTTPDGNKKSTHKPIVCSNTAETTTAVKNPNQLTAQERLELRAKKFGIKSNTTVTATATAVETAISKSSSASIVANKGNKDTDEQQKEALKRRAERFGCIVPEKSPKTASEDKLQKRKDRFGIAGTTTTVSTKPTTTTTTQSSVYAEKARARLERFKVTPDATKVSTVAAAAPTTVATASTE